MLPIAALIPLAISVAKDYAPKLLGHLFGSKAGETAEKVLGTVQSVTGIADPEQAVAALRANQEMQLKFAEAANSLEMSIQHELTARHQADMASDSWLSKNVRPLCLLTITLFIGAALFIPSISIEKFAALQELGVWVYGYYFVGRSTFDKGNVKLKMGKS